MFCFLTFKAGVDKLRPSKEKSAALEHVFIFNRIRPAKGKSETREHVELARQTKNCRPLLLSNIYFHQHLNLCLWLTFSYGIEINFNA